MEGSWLRARKRSRSAVAARLRRAAQSRRASMVGKERRRRAATWGAVGRKFRELQALVPGGEGLHADQLFLHTAGYILHLRHQMHVLRALSELYVP